MFSRGWCSDPRRSGCRGSCHIARCTILFSSSVDLYLTCANRRIGVGVVPDAPCILVFLLIEVGANVKMLTEVSVLVCMWERQVVAALGQ